MTTASRRQIPPEDCPNRVREHRLARGFSQGELARLTGFHRADVASIERGRKPLLPWRIRRLALVLGVEEHQLIREENHDQRSRGNREGDSTR